MTLDKTRSAAERAQADSRVGKAAYQALNDGLTVRTQPNQVCTVDFRYLVVGGLDEQKAARRQG